MRSGNVERDLGDNQEFLCMRIVKPKGHIKIDQVDYLHKVLQWFIIS